VAVIATNAGAIRVEHGFGPAELGRGDAMTSQSGCNWFSMTKPGSAGGCDARGSPARPNDATERRH
jgi:hypothetical protein